MKQPDLIYRFLFEQADIRGQHISLDSSWQRIVEQSDAEPAALVLLGQALAAAALLVETLKIEGSISLQVRGDGPVHLLMAEATSRHSIRGIVRQNRSIEADQSLESIFSANALVITINTGDKKPYQGIVPLQGNSLTEILQTYFDQSEQLPTRLWLAADVDGASGLLLQQMPGESHDDDAWNRLLMLTDTVEDNELLELETTTLLHRLYNQEQLRLFPAESIRFACSCSRERTLNMLHSLGEEEIKSILEEQGEVRITCEFCDASYSFDAVDLGEVFSEADSQPSTPSLH